MSARTEARGTGRSTGNMASVNGANRSGALILGLFLFLAAAVCAVAPLPLVLRSAGVLLFSYISFAVAGSQVTLLTACSRRSSGCSRREDWLVMLPIILASNLLGMLGLEFSWRYAAVVVHRHWSPRHC